MKETGDGQDQAGLLMTEEIILTFDKVKETGLGDPSAEGMVRIRLDYNDEVIEVIICTFATFT